MIKMQKDRSLTYIYVLSTIGDLTYSLLLTASVLYGTQLGGSPSQTGLIGGAYGITYIILPGILGKIGDRIPRKTSMLIAVIGQLLASAYYIFFADSIPELVLGQIFFGIAYGFYWPGIEAYISEKTHDTPENHQRGMSNFCIAWGLGFTVGPLIAGILSDIQVRYTFTIAFFIYTISLLIVLFGVSRLTEEDHAAYGEFKEDTEADPYEGLSPNEREFQEKYDKYVSIRLLFGMLIYALLVKIVLTYFTDFAVREDLLNWSGTQTGQVVFIFGIGREIYYLLSRFSKSKIFKSTLKRISFGFAVFALLLILIASIENLILMSAVFFIFGMFVGLVYLTSLDLLIVRERKSKGAKAGLFESTIGFGAMLAPIVAGYLAEANPYTPFYFFAALVLIVFAFNMISRKMIAKKR